MQVSTADFKKGLKIVFDGQPYTIVEFQYLKENLEVDMLYIDGSPAAVELPNFVELAIAQTDPGVRGDTAQGGTKPATLETGAVVQVPLFLNEGDIVKVDTRTGEYLGRV